MKFLPSATIIAFLLFVEKGVGQYYDVVVVSSELAGMTAAYKMKQYDPNIKLVVLEASDRVGGRGASIVFSGNVIPVYVDDILTELGIGGVNVAVDTIIERMSKSVDVRVNQSVSSAIVTADYVLTTTTMGIPYISNYLVISLPSQRANAISIQYEGNMDASAINDTRVFYGGVSNTSLGIEFVSNAILAGERVADVIQARRQQTTIPTPSTIAPPISIVTVTSKPDIAASVENLFINLINLIVALLRSVEKA